MKTINSKIIALIIIFALFSCSKDSLSDSFTCIPVSCLNGGKPTPNCSCDCPQGYLGNNCGTQRTPSKITISKIDIVSYPLTDPSAVTGYWDYPNNKNPDLAILISNVTTSELLSDSSNVPVMNALPYTTYTYTYPSFQITNVNNLFKIELRDIDLGSNPSFQIMNTYYFTIYDAFGGFPNVINITDGETKYNIYISYTW